MTLSDFQGHAPTAAVDKISRDIVSASRGPSAVAELFVLSSVFNARRRAASAILFCPSVRPSVRPSVKCDFSYSCAAADKISTDLRRRAVPLR